MGDIADMMLDGTLCEGCGEYLGSDFDGPALCGSCANWREENLGHEMVDVGGGFVDAGPDSSPQPTITVELPKNIKVICPKCERRIKAIGFADHWKDVHEEQADDWP